MFASDATRPKPVLCQIPDPNFRDLASGSYGHESKPTPQKTPEEKERGILFAACNKRGLFVHFDGPGNFRVVRKHVRSTEILVAGTFSTCIEWIDQQPPQNLCPGRKVLGDFPPGRASRP